MNVKKIIIILSIILIILLSIIGIILSLNLNNNVPDEEGAVPEDFFVDRKLQVEDNKNNFFTIENCVNKFYEYLFEEDSGDYLINDEEVTEYLENQEETVKKALYSMLDESYIQYANITMDNIFEKINRMGTSTLQISNMLVSQRDLNVSLYFVNGTLQDNLTKEIQNFELLLKVDMKNETFKIFLQDYIEQFYNNITEGQEIEFETFTEISNDEYNIFDYEIITEEEYVGKLFDDLKNDLLYNRQRAYESLDENYKQIKFKDYSQFEEYAIENVRENVQMQLTKYQINNYDDYTQYVCVDQNGKYYIFNETAVMDYTLILDTYTIDLPQFTEQYNNSTDSEKVLLNIQKIFSALNDGDYSYVYGKLDTTFKQNNFPTEADFETYIKANFYENNNIAYSNYQTSGNLHIFEISITNADDETSSTINKNFIMQLLEGTDFVMSFNVQ